MKALNRVDCLYYIMQLQGLSKTDVADTFSFDKKVVDLWLDIKNVEAQIPKDKLCALMDVGKIMVDKGLTLENPGPLGVEQIDYLKAWMKGSLPITIKAGISLLVYGGA